MIVSIMVSLGFPLLTGFVSGTLGLSASEAPQWEPVAPVRQRHREWHGHRHRGDRFFLYLSCLITVMICD